MKLFFRKYGSGPALFILHGLYGSSDNWVTIARRLSGNFTVYLPDQRTMDNRLTANGTAMILWQMTFLNLQLN